MMQYKLCPQHTPEVGAGLGRSTSSMCARAASLQCRARMSVETASKGWHALQVGLVEPHGLGSLHIRDRFRKDAGAQVSAGHTESLCALMA
jgi:hypothetical protein